jgi:hypothetical protein
MHNLLQIRSRDTGQPGESPERQRQHEHVRELLQIVQLAARIFLIKREFDERKTTLLPYWGIHPSRRGEGSLFSTAECAALDDSFRLA